MPRVGFEPTIPVFERANTVHALDCAAAVIDQRPVYTPPPNYQVNALLSASEEVSCSKEVDILELSLFLFRLTS
jgi:hypothetical protein